MSASESFYTEGEPDTLEYSRTSTVGSPLASPCARTVPQPPRAPAPGAARGKHQRVGRALLPRVWALPTSGSRPEPRMQTALTARLSTPGCFLLGGGHHAHPKPGGLPATHTAAEPMREEMRGNPQPLPAPGAPTAPHTRPAKGGTPAATTVTGRLPAECQEACRDGHGC